MPDPKLEVLTPHNSQLIFIDHQPQMAFGVQSIDRQVLKNNTVALAKAAKIFDIPTTITTVESDSFSGYTYPELFDVFPGHKILERMYCSPFSKLRLREWRGRGVRPRTHSALGSRAPNGDRWRCTRRASGPARRRRRPGWSTRAARPAPP